MIIAARLLKYFHAPVNLQLPRFSSDDSLGYSRGSWPIPERLDWQQHCRRGGGGPQGTGRELPYQPVQPQHNRQALQGKLVHRSVQLIDRMPTDRAGDGR